MTYTCETDLGSEDFTCAWLACETKGALRPGVLPNAFSSWAGGSWKTHQGHEGKKLSWDLPIKQNKQLSTNWCWKPNLPWAHHPLKKHLTRQSNVCSPFFSTNRNDEEQTISDGITKPNQQHDY